MILDAFVLFLQIAEFVLRSNVLFNLLHHHHRSLLPET